MIFSTHPEWGVREWLCGAVWGLVAEWEAEGREVHLNSFCFSAFFYQFQTIHIQN